MILCAKNYVNSKSQLSSKYTKSNQSCNTYACSKMNITVLKTTNEYIMPLSGI